MLAMPAQSCLLVGLLGSTLLACSSGSSGSESGDTRNAGASSAETADAAPSAPDCDGITCDYATQYCMITAFRGTANGSKCLPLPSGCNACGCAQSDASTHYSTDDYNGACASNGTGKYACNQTGNAVVVECSWGD